MYIDGADEAKLVKEARAEVFSGSYLKTLHDKLSLVPKFIQLCDNDQMNTKICAAKTNKQTNNNHCSTHAPNPMSILNRA